MTDHKELVKQLKRDYRVRGEKFLIEAAAMIETLAKDKTRLMARLERDHGFRLIDGKMVRVEMELDDDTDGIACRDETILELENRLSSAFAAGAMVMKEDAAKCIDEMAAQIVFYTLADGAAAIRTLPISTLKVTSDDSGSNGERT